MKTECQIIFPTNYIEDKLLQAETEAKGYLRGVRLKVGGTSYTLTFYDPVRLLQDIEEEFKLHGFFFESNLVTITNVDKKNIINALDNIVDTGTYQDMVKDN
ncbi:hypothetical protein [uncultured Duncaniella sp.]|uniref:hypothetical protein n=1 Tax=uncultured Duncaniella sp. TaxID=2768039 RepID=UPI0025B20241|nr:hypothetical protein [uncultured Duncaniella sp.]